MLPGDREFVRQYCDLEAELRRLRDGLDEVPPEYPWLRQAVEREIDAVTGALECMRERARAEVRRRRAA